MESFLLDLGLIILFLLKLLRENSIISLSSSPLKYLASTYPSFSRLLVAKSRTSKQIEFVLKESNFLLPVVFEAISEIIISIFLNSSKIFFLYPHL